MKSMDVCSGCKYLAKRCDIPAFNNTCDYLTITGHSRLKAENENGGYKKDSCVCYEKGRRKTRRAVPLRIKGGVRNEG